MLTALAIWQAVKAFAKSIPWQVWLAIGVVLALLAAWAWHNSQVSEAATEGRKEGATAQRETDLIETIDRTEQSNETRHVIEGEVRSGAGSNLYDQCLRTARTPANCQRFMPSE
jgi:cytoskeletal protein RodZ